MNCLYVWCFFQILGGFIFKNLIFIKGKFYLVTVNVQWKESNLVGDTNKDENECIKKCIDWFLNLKK